MLYPSLRKVSDKWGNYSNVRIVNFRIPNRFLDLSSRFFSFPRIDHWLKADIFYSPHLNILSFRQPQKHLLTIHDLSFIHYPEFFSLSRKLWHWRQGYRRQIQEAGKIIAVSDFTKADLIDSLGVAEEKITRIYPGVNPFYQVQSFTDQAEKPFLLYLGALEPRKNILALIKAFNIIKQNKKFRDLELIIVGARGWLYNKIFKEASHSSWSDSIKFLGAVSNQELLRLYNLAQVFVYPS
ncbi:MAG: glycosyltransferase family 4 protein, partial [Bacteroidetes bacterium]|nr:glycosyltransferase family 4 protein [Bacteroidota bacterium]